MDREEERAALQAVIEGNKESFGVIVREYQPKAYAVALSLVGNAHDAVDLCQDAFLRAWKARKRFDLDQPFFPWFYRILRNVCLSHLKSRGGKRRFLSLRRHSRQDDEEIEVHVPSEAPGPEVLAENNDESMKLYRALQTLPLRDREILHLRHFEELSYAEIAEALAIPMGTVMSRLFYARRKLRELLEEASA